MKKQGGRAREGQAFSDAMVRRMMNAAKVNPDGSISVSFTQDMVNEALVEIGVSPINGEPIAEQDKTTLTDGQRPEEATE